MAMDALPDPEVRFVGKTGDAAVDSALLGVTQGTNWSQVGIQIGQFAGTSGFVAAYVRRDRFDLEVVVEQGWSGQLEIPFAQTELDHAWDIQKQLNSYVNNFHLSDAAKAEARAVLSKYGETVSTTAPAAPGVAPAAKGWDINVDEVRRATAQGDPSAAASNPYDLPIAVALFALNLIVDIADAGSATGTLIFAAPDGLSDPMRERLDSSPGMGHEDKMVLSLRPPSMYAVGVDGPSLVCHGWTPPGSVEVAELQRSLQYYVAERTSRTLPNAE